jgi:hypothetical protein
MPTNDEEAQERDPTNQPSGPLPRGGGDISGRGETPDTDSSDEDGQESDDSAHARE